MALLPPGAVGEVWPYTLPGGRAPGPQDRGFLVVRGDPRELRLGAHGAPRGADEKPLRRKRSAALQPEPIQVYGQVSGRPPRLPSALFSPCAAAPPHPSLAVASQVQAPLGLPGWRLFFSLPHLSTTIST